MRACACQRILGLAWLLAIPSVSASQTKAFAARDFQAARQHWAYQPIRKPPVPTVHNQHQARSPIDAFILLKLETKRLTFSPPADRRTLIRRAYYDLIGLPPTYEEIEAFLNDRSPDAFAKVVDRLLASPHYGERWGRHWLDVARYADTKDLVLQYGKDRLRPFAYTYRDYVIRALNLDTPFDRFIHEQIAADQLEPTGETWRLAALGFLTLGRLYDNNPHDQIDDQIDTVTRGFIGLTVACARCHDHKYDAIPTEDYYSLYGVFASSERPYDLPLIEDPNQVEGALGFEKKWAEAKQKLEALVDAEYEKLLATARGRVGDYLARVATSEPDITETSSFFLSLSPEDLRPGLVMRWRRYLEEHRHEAVFGLWSVLMDLPEEEFAQRAAEIIPAFRSPATASGAAAWNPLIVQAFARATLTNKADVARIYGQVFKGVYEQSLAGSGAPPRDPTPFPDPAHGSAGEAEQQILAMMIGQASPVYFPKSQTPQHLSRVEKDNYNRLVADLDKIAAHATNQPPARAMIVRDAQELYHPRVFVRGSPANPGEPVPRAFLRVLAGEHRKPFEHGSGRLDLGRAITALENPLTARVIVNRVWMHHFGEPLVNTPSDFGARSDPPPHPELLDYLAWSFVHERGWSLKKLHRLIMLSHAYQQASRDRTECRQLDPENRFLWRSNRRRLQLEAMRDSLLIVSGRLDSMMEGPAVDVARDPNNRRRTVYGLVDRQDLPAMFRAFDFVCPDQSIERRPSTSVPQQALFAMNSPFVIQQAKALAARPEVTTETEPARRVSALYRRVLAREPTKDEVSSACRFIQETESEGIREGQFSAWEQLAQVLLMTNELMFVD